MISLQLFLMVTHLVTANGNSIFMGHPVIFPDSGIINIKERKTENQTEQKIFPSCGNQTVLDYCIDPPNYPEQHILDAISSQQGILRSFFDIQIRHHHAGVAITPFANTEKTGFSGSESQANKFNTTEEIEKAEFVVTTEDYYDYPLEEFENVCRMTHDHIMPRAAKNTKGEFKFIVNHPGGNNLFTQKVQVGECVNQNKDCGDGSTFDRKTECRQEFLEHKLVSVSQDGDQVVVDTFRFPSCCTCYIKRSEDYF